MAGPKDATAGRRRRELSPPTPLRRLDRARRPEALALDELPGPGVLQAAGLDDLDAGRVGPGPVALAVDQQVLAVVVHDLVVAVEDGGAARDAQGDVAALAAPGVGAVVEDLGG